eukprot:TRINITY_DN3136_c0_g1_i1.p1 TRINITY_DN3136_c0_g1~~TRINITY_DN3136_c0_g1_i1.p1  ORF type:complete len:1106 (+),score=84.01 TRINITY_DN3136_c0_g1_i1:69-3386(+)
MRWLVPALLALPAAHSQDECPANHCTNQDCIDPDHDVYGDWQCHCKVGIGAKTGGRTNCVARAALASVDECAACPARMVTTGAEGYAGRALRKLPLESVEECTTECARSIDCFAYAYYTHTSRVDDGGCVFQYPCCKMFRSGHVVTAPSLDTLYGIKRPGDNCENGACSLAGGTCRDPTAGTETLNDWQCWCAEGAWGAAKLMAVSSCVDAQQPMKFDECEMGCPQIAQVVQQNVRYAGTLTNALPIESKEQCTLECTRTGRCNFFSWTPDSLNDMDRCSKGLPCCMMFSSTTELIDHSTTVGFVSGEKRDFSPCAFPMPQANDVCASDDTGHCFDPTAGDDQLGDWQCRCNSAPDKFMVAWPAQDCPTPTSVPASPAPVTQVPPTPAPETLVPPTQVPATKAPPTPAPETSVPPTQVPATKAPPTPAPETSVPPTQVPATKAPPTPAPETSVPPTQVPATKAPPTPAPETLVPPTQVPATKASPTTAPETLVPSTEGPTAAPATLAPATIAPATNAPVTPAPGTSAPVTNAPNTRAPATNAPAAPILIPSTQVPATPNANADTRGPGTPAPETARESGAPSVPGGAGGLRAEAEDVVNVVTRASLVGALVGGILGDAAGSTRLLASAVTCDPVRHDPMERYVFIMSPMGLEVGGSRPLGTVLGNVVLVVAVAAVWYGLALLAGLVGLPRMVGQEDAFGLVCFPAVPLLVNQVVYQGTALASADLIFAPQAPWELACGAAGVLYCIAVPCAQLHLCRRAVHAHAWVMEDRRCAWKDWLVGRGEWVSATKRHHWIERYAHIRMYNDATYWYPVLEYCTMFAISALQAPKPESYLGCGHIKLFTAFVCVVTLLLEMHLWPHLAVRNCALDVMILGGQAVAMSCLAWGYYTGNREDIAFLHGAHLLLGCILVLLIRMALEGVGAAFSHLSGRRRRLQKMAWATVERDAPIVKCPTFETDEEGVCASDAAVTPRCGSSTLIFPQDTPTPGFITPVGRSDVSAVDLPSPPRKATRDGRGRGQDSFDRSMIMSPDGRRRRRGTVTGSKHHLSASRLNLSLLDRWGTDASFQQLPSPRGARHGSSLSAHTEPPARKRARSGVRLPQKEKVLR